jgi:hypothetical protein
MLWKSTYLYILSTLQIATKVREIKRAILQAIGKIALGVGVSTFVYCTLHEPGLHFYNIQCVQTFQRGGPPSRVTFCQ